MQLEHILVSFKLIHFTQPCCCLLVITGLAEGGYVYFLKSVVQWKVTGFTASDEPPGCPVEGEEEGTRACCNKMMDVK